MRGNGLERFREACTGEHDGILVYSVSSNGRCREVGVDDRYHVTVTCTPQHIQELCREQRMDALEDSHLGELSTVLSIVCVWLSYQAGLGAEESPAGDLTQQQQEDQTSQHPPLELKLLRCDDVMISWFPQGMEISFSGQLIFAVVVGAGVAAIAIARARAQLGTQLLGVHCADEGGAHRANEGGAYRADEGTGGAETGGKETGDSAHPISLEDALLTDSTSTGQHLTLDRLPPEIMDVVAGFLDAHALVQFASVCHGFHSCAASDSLWRALLQQLDVVIDGEQAANSSRLLYSRVLSAISANDSFYRHFRQRDMRRMQSLWLSDVDIAPISAAPHQSAHAALVRSYPAIASEAAGGKTRLRPLCRHPGRPTPILGWAHICGSWMQIFASGGISIWPRCRRIVVSPCGGHARLELVEEVSSSRGIRTPGPGIPAVNHFLLQGGSAEGPDPSPGPNGSMGPGGTGSSRGWRVVVHDAGDPSATPPLTMDGPTSVQP